MNAAEARHLESDLDLVAEPAEGMLEHDVFRWTKPSGAQELIPADSRQIEHGVEGGLVEAFVAAFGAMDEDVSRLSPSVPMRQHG